ncbi:MAG: cupin domain-containing protein [Solirubrobacteraceae bacterium]|nr:cupin domain-containing protein [Solirubrobacteraceae bacterium]
MSYVKKQLRDVEDSAPGHGFGEVQEARFATKDLEAVGTGIAYHVLRPGKRQPFAHKHDAAEEVYVVISGSGRIALDEDVVELETMDAVRIPPEITRRVEAGPEGIEFLAFGPRHEGDGELVQGFWDE